MIGELPPGLILIAGALIVPIFRGWLRSAYLLALPLVGLGGLTVLDPGSFGTLVVFDYALTPVRIDKLSLAFGYIFHIAAFLVALYALNVNRTAEQVAALIYVGAAVGALFAGDLLTLFIYWELTALASVFVVWEGRTERAYRAGMRYLIVQVTSGVLLLVGAIGLLADTGTLAFDHIGLGSTAGILIFLAFGIKCAFPLLHNWLPDAYPEASVSGTVILSAFTTKLAVYALARGFAGTEWLIWIGTVMTAFPIVYAIIENDLRRVLAYSLNIQLGFMVVAIGIGTELALNGAVAHAIVHILYKALLFMSVGAVLYRAGTAKASELGGLYKSMPWTAGFCIVGAASIAAVPLLGGFVSKSFITSAVANDGLLVAWLVLIGASAAVLHYAGIKIPYFAFFGDDSGKRCEEAPMTMLLAMGATAVLCVAAGIFPMPLYEILPYPVDYQPYTGAKVVAQLQLLLFSALAFAMLIRTGLFPAQLRSVNLDADWFYRRLAPAVAVPAFHVLAGIRSEAARRLEARLSALVQGLARSRPVDGAMSRTMPTGGTVLWMVILLAGYLVIYYL